MSKPRLIGPVRASPPTDTLRLTSGGRTLPYDLLQEASHRLGVMSLLGSVLWVLGTVFYHLAMRALAPPGDTSWMQPLPTDTVAAAAAIVSAALFVYTRKANRSPKFILDLGLGVSGTHLDGNRPGHALGTSAGRYPGHADDHVDRRRRAHVRGDRSQRPVENAGGRPARRVHEPPGDARGASSRHLGFRTRQST